MRAQCRSLFLGGGQQLLRWILWLSAWCPSPQSRWLKEQTGQWQQRLPALMALFSAIWVDISSAVTPLIDSPMKGTYAICLTSLKDTLSKSKEQDPSEISCRGGQRKTKCPCVAGGIGCTDSCMCLNCGNIIHTRVNSATPSPIFSYHRSDEKSQNVHS